MTQYAIYPTPEAASAVLSEINATYCACIVEMRSDGTIVPLEERVTKQWAELRQYQEGYGFPVPPGELSVLCMSGTVVQEVNELPSQDV